MYSYIYSYTLAASVVIRIDNSSKKNRRKIRRATMGWTSKVLAG